MGQYSVKGSAMFDALVDRHMQLIADEVWSSSYSKHWDALVLCGSYGRGEGALLIGKNGEELPQNDYNLMVVASRDGSLIRGALGHLEKRLAAELGLPVKLGLCLKRNLPQRECSLLNYEIKYGHRVIRGDEGILNRMPEYSHDQIPPSEGTRLLMNRGRLLLDIKRRLADGEPLTTEERRRFIQYILKVNLAFGDCALLIRNSYDACGDVKKARIKDVDLHGLHDARGMVTAYQQAIELREHADIHPLDGVNIHLRLDEAALRFQSFFLWYEQRALNRKFKNIKKYAHSFPRLGNEGAPLKNALLNLQTFGVSAFPHLFTHPRIRLYPATALLLDTHPDLPDIRWLLNSTQSRLDGLFEEFIALHQQFS